MVEKFSIFIPFLIGGTTVNHQRATIPAREQGKADNPEKKSFKVVGFCELCQFGIRLKWRHTSREKILANISLQ